MQSIICTHHRRHFNNASNVSVLPGYTCNRLQILNSGSWLLSHYFFDWGAILLTLNHACYNSNSCLTLSMYPFGPEFTHCEDGCLFTKRTDVYSKISWGLETARFAFTLLQSVWNLTGTSAAVLPRCLSNIRTIRSLQRPILRLRDFTRFGCKTSARLVSVDPGLYRELSTDNQWCK